MPTTIDQLQIEIETKSEKANQGLNKLKSTLQSLNKVAQASGLDITCKRLEKIASMDFSNLSALTNLAKTTKPLQDMNERIRSVTDSAAKLPKNIGMSIDTSVISDTVTEMQSVASTLRDIPNEITASVQMQGVNEATTALESVASAAESVPNEIKAPIEDRAIEGSRLLAENLVQTSTQADILKFKISGIKEKLATVLRAPKWDANGVANIISQAQKLQAELDRLSNPIKEISLEETMPMAENLIKTADAAKILEMKLDGVKMKLAETLRTPNYDMTSVANLTSQAQKLQAELDKAGKGVRKLGTYFKEMYTSAVSSFKKAGRGVSQLLRIVLVYGGAFRAFQLFTQGMSEGLQNIAKYSDETATSMNKLSTMSLYLKNSIGAALYPVIVAVTPALQSMTNAIVRALNVFNQFVATWGGATTFIKAKEYLKEYGDTAKSTANQIKRSFAGIDEITVIGNQDSGSSGDTPDYSQMFETAPISEKVSSVVENLKKNLDNLKIILGGAALVVGAILTFSGADIPLGLGLMAVGGYLLGSAIQENWNFVDGTLQEKFNSIMLIIAGAMIVVGALLAFSGAATGLGIALLIGGAAVLATAVAENWDELPSKIKDKITYIGIILGAGLIVIGACLAFSGAAIPLGIGLMIVGAAELATAVTLGWDTLPENIKNVLSIILAVVSGLLLVIGVVLCCCAVIPLGIALIVIGVVGIATAAAVNWEWVKEKVKTVLSALLSIVSAAVLVLGVILCLSGAGIPIGLGLIALGAKGIDKAAQWDDNAVTSNIKKSLDKIKTTISNWWDSLKKWWSGLSLSQINFKMPHFTWTSTPADGWIAKVLSALSLPTSLPKLNVSWYANGGFPAMGEMFVAREGGPEMVGTIGNKTAVANNNQIVESIQGGVYAANQEQNALLREQNDLLRKLLAKDSTVHVSTSDIEQGLLRKNRRNGTTTVPVG